MARDQVPWLADARKAFAEAIEAVGGQLKMAEGLAPPPAKTIPQSTISFWLNQAAKGVPPEYVIAIEKLSRIKGLRHRLRPDVYPPKHQPAAVA